MNDRTCTTEQIHDCTVNNEHGPGGNPGKPCLLASGQSSQPPSPRRLTILTQNVQGLGKDLYKLDEISHSLIHKNRANADIMLLQETKRQGQDHTRVNTCEFFFHGRTDGKRENHGVGIALSPKGQQAWINANRPDPIRINCIHGHGARLMGLSLHFREANHTEKIFVISAYFPTESYTDEEYESCLDALGSLISKAPSGSKLFIGGDFNARIGTRKWYSNDEDLVPRYIGPHGLDETNSRGELLAAFITARGLYNAASFFKKGDHTTWQCANAQKRRHQIDYVFVSEIRSIRDCVATYRNKVGSDHDMIKIRFQSKQSSRKKKPSQNFTSNAPPTKRIDFSCVTSPFKKKINQELSDELGEEKPGTVLFTETLIEVAQKHLPEKVSCRDWFNRKKDALLGASSARNLAERRYQKDRSELNRNLARHARKALRQEVWKAKEQWITEQIAYIEGKIGSPHEAWLALDRVIDGLSGHHKTQGGFKLEKPDGSLTSTDKEKLSVTVNHFKEEVFGRQSPFEQSAIDELDNIPIAPKLGELPSFGEFKEKVKQAKRHKAAGPNRIQIEMYQLLNDQNLRLVYDLVCRYWTEPDFDFDDWHKVTLTLIPKKKNPKKAKDLRPIALLDVMSKVLSSIIGTRLMIYMQKHGLREQAGFTLGRGCSDASATLKMVLQSLQHSNQDSFVLFIDLVIAFDSVNRDMLWKLLEKYGVPPALIMVIQKMYTNIEISVSVGKEKSSFKSTSGVKQGDNLAPVLFLFAIMAAADLTEKHWTFAKPDLKISTDRYLNYRDRKKKSSSPISFNKSFYADDAAYVLLSRQDLVEATKLIVNQYKRLGLTVHLGVKTPQRIGSKTEALFIPGRSQEPVDTTGQDADYDVDDQHFISFCDSFKYLGTVISQDLTDSAEITKRIQAARFSFLRMKPVLCNKRLPKKLRARYYRQGPLNKLLYGCEGWALTAQHRNQLQAFHHDCARKIYGITRWHHQHEKITMEKVRTELGLQTTDEVIDKRTLDFMSKKVLNANNSVVYDIAVSHAEPREGRKRGRPPMTTRKAWCKILEKISGTICTATNITTSMAKKICREHSEEVLKNRESASR